MAKVKDRIAPDLKTLEVEIDTLQPDPENARKRTDENIAAIRASFEAFGQQRPLLVFRFKRNERPTVISGNGGYLAAKALGWPTVAASHFNGTAEEARAYAIADNRTAEMSEWDAAVLGLQVEASRAHAHLAAVMDSLNLDDLLAQYEEEEQAEDHVEQPKSTIAKRGDRWMLGPHRLACGDARDPAVLEWILEGEAPACVFTDPPYGVSYESSSGKHDAIAGDDLRGDALIALLQEVFTPIAKAVRPTAAWYVWHASSTREEFAWALKAAGLIEHQYLIWAKPAAVLGHADYQWSHEPCFYMSRAGERPQFYGDRAQSTVWRFVARTDSGMRAAVISPGILLSDGRGATIYVTTQRPKKRTRAARIAPGFGVLLTPETSDTTIWEVGRESKAEHPTQKPVELVVRALANSTAAGQTVLDPFMGSGSTIMGAERTGRRAVGCELSPAYVDYAIARWEKATGRKAERA